jgi:phosphocarrier protein
MSEVTASRQVTVTNPNGLHARPAHLIAKAAGRFLARVDVIKDGQRANGKSILDILMLAAAQGTALIIEARGGDAHEAVEAVAYVVEQPAPPEETAQ